MPSHMEIYNPLYPKKIGKFTMYHSMSRAIHMTENGILSCFVFKWFQKEVVLSITYQIVELAVSMHMAVQAAEEDGHIYGMTETSKVSWTPNLYLAHIS